MTRQALFWICLVLSLSGVVALAVSTWSYSTRNAAYASEALRRENLKLRMLVESSRDRHATPMEIQTDANAAGVPAVVVSWERMTPSYQKPTVQPLALESFLPLVLLVCALLGLIMWCQTHRPSASN